MFNVMRLRILEICKEQGITQKALAEQIGLSAVGLSKAINGNPTLQTLEKIANTLKVPVSELIDEPKSGNFTCPQCGAVLRLSAEKAE